MTYYNVSHLTRYIYSDTVTASMMEVRVQPRHDGHQHLLGFNLMLSPKAKAMLYRDYMNNPIHIFDIPGEHKKLAIKADSMVELREPPAIPKALPDSAWDALRREHLDRDLFDMLQSSDLTDITPLARSFFDELNIRPQADPLSTVLAVNSALYGAIQYVQNVTGVDSPIDQAIGQRQGVCQDYTHIMLAALRDMGIPARYVSGYLYHQVAEQDRSAEDATHAWVEAWLPEIGWVGFDPTNNLICGSRHIRVCIGRDYSEAAPTKGVFTGAAETMLEVSVQVTQMDELPNDETPTFSFTLPDYDLQQQQQQQQ